MTFVVLIDFICFQLIRSPKSEPTDLDLGICLRIRFHHQHNKPPLPSSNTIRHVITNRLLVKHGRTN